MGFFEVTKKVFEVPQKEYVAGQMHLSGLNITDWETKYGVSLSARGNDDWVIQDEYIDADDLIDAAENLEDLCKIMRDGNFCITLDRAVDIVYAYIQNKSKSKDSFAIAYTGRGVVGDILSAIRNMTSANKWKFEAPPTANDGLKYCTAEDHKNWLGAILHFLYREGCIEKYWIHGTNYFVQVKPKG